MLKQTNSDKTLQLTVILLIMINLIGFGIYFYMDHVYNISGFPNYYITKNMKLDCYSTSVELVCYSHDDRHVDPNEISKTLNSDEYSCNKIHPSGLLPGKPYTSCMKI